MWVSTKEVFDYFSFYFTDKSAFRKSTHSYHWGRLNFITKSRIKKHVSWCLIFAGAEVWTHITALSTTEAAYNPVSFCHECSGKQRGWNHPSIGLRKVKKLFLTFQGCLSVSSLCKIDLELILSSLQKLVWGKCEVESIEQSSCQSLSYGFDVLLI